MLVVKRKRRTRLKIGDAIITVEKITSNYVVLSVDAPRHVLVRRMDPKTDEKCPEVSEGNPDEPLTESSEKGTGHEEISQQKV